MKHKFTLGALSGIAIVAVAVPVLAQFSSAALPAPADDVTSPFARVHVLTQQEVTDMAARDEAYLANVDAFVAVQKEAVSAHVTALRTAAAIADDDQRHTAVREAHEAMRTTIDDAIEANPDLESARYSFGGGRGFGKHGVRGPGGPHGADLSSKLGMTEDEFRAALDSGKSIEDIAAEKGVTLPGCPFREGGKGMGMGRMQRGE